MAEVAVEQKQTRGEVQSHEALSSLNSLTLETGHEDMIHDARTDFTGKRLATASADKSIRIFDVSTEGSASYHLVAELFGHTGPIWQISWAHPKLGGFLASCSFDRTVIIWRETVTSFYSTSRRNTPLLSGRGFSESQMPMKSKWEEFYKFEHHESSVVTDSGAIYYSAVNSVSWAPSEYGLILACASSDSSVSILSYLETESRWSKFIIPDAHVLGCNSLSWCPYIYSGDGPDGDSPTKKIVTGGNDNTVKVWREDKGVWTEEATLFGHSDWVRDVAWSPSSRISNTKIASASQDRRVIVWNYKSMDEKDMSTWVPEIVHIFDDVVWNVSWSFSGDYLAVSGGENSVTLWKCDDNGGGWICTSGSLKKGKSSNDRKRK